MKYQKNHPKQFEVLKQVLTVLNNHVSIENVNNSQLHFLVYQQFSSGQSHNALYIRQDGLIQRQYKFEHLRNCKKLININFDFELYPSGINDDHIETAIKQIKKILTLS